MTVKPPALRVGVSKVIIVCFLFGIYKFNNCSLIYIQHKDWKSSSNVVYGYDICLFKLDKEVNFTKEIQPACLPLHSFNGLYTLFPSFDETGVIAGWGKLNGSDEFSASNILQNVKVKVTGRLFQNGCAGEKYASLKNSVICLSSRYCLMSCLNNFK